MKKNTYEKFMENGDKLKTYKCGIFTTGYKVRTKEGDTINKTTLAGHVFNLIDKLKGKSN